MSQLRQDIEKALITRQCHHRQGSFRSSNVEVYQRVCCQQTQIHGDQSNRDVKSHHLTPTKLISICEKDYFIYWRTVMHSKLLQNRFSRPNPSTVDAPGLMFSLVPSNQNYKADTARRSMILDIQIYLSNKPAISSFLNTTCSSFPPRSPRYQLKSLPSNSRAENPFPR